MAKNNTLLMLPPIVDDQQLCSMLGSAICVCGKELVVVPLR